MTIGENIKKLRKEKGLTQQELADKINKSKSTVQKYESGDTNLRVSIGNYERNDREPRIGVLNEIAKALGVTIQELITGETQEHEIIEKDISEFSTDELLRELNKRGYQIIINKIGVEN